MTGVSMGQRQERNGTCPAWLAQTTHGPLGGDGPTLLNVPFPRLVDPRCPSA